MRKKIEPPKTVNRIWPIINVIGMVIIAISVITGIYLLIQSGSSNHSAAMGMSMPGVGAIEMLSGFLVMIQGSIAGLLLMAFSKLGESVNRIENSLSKQK
jgi:hypothetical protein